MPTETVPPPPDSLTVISPGRAVWRELPPGLGPPSLEMDGEFSRPDTETTELHLLVTEQACANGEAMDDRLLGPEVVETADAVYVAFAVVARQGHFTCPGSPSERVVVTLAAPLGQRVVLDGLSNLPIRRARGYSYAQFPNYRAAVAQLKDRLAARDLLPIAREEIARRAEWFTVGSDGTEMFWVEARWSRLVPRGTWTMIGAWQGEFDSVVRDDGRRGVYARCGPLFIELLHLDGDAMAADELLAQIHSEMCDG